MNHPSTHHTGLRFKPGLVFATPAARAVLRAASVSALALLLRHLRGDWGELCEADRVQNELALTTGARVLSSYTLPEGEKIWLISEAHHTITTILLPDDY